jgi:hypothetical protein
VQSHLLALPQTCNEMTVVLPMADWSVLQNLLHAARKKNKFSDMGSDVPADLDKPF